MKPPRVPVRVFTEHWWHGRATHPRRVPLRTRSRCARASSACVRSARRTAVLIALVAVLTANGANATCPTPPGDVTGDGSTNVVDVVCGVLASLWDLNGRTDAIPACVATGNYRRADANCDGAINIVDVQVLAFQALGLVPAAVDLDGDLCADACQDTTPPVVTIASPVKGTVFGTLEPIQVTGTVADDSPVTVSVQGIEATIAPDGTFTAQGVSLVEGRNVIVAVATDVVGNTSTATVLVEADVTPPRISIETPPDGVLVNFEELDVTGLVNDLIEGTTIQSDDVTVTVNGLVATVSNRAWELPNVRLKPGPNTIVATATDAAGNTAAVTHEVTVDPDAGQHIVPVDGNDQTADPGELLPRALAVQLLDAQGDPVAGRPVEFTVIRGDGNLEDPPRAARSLTVLSDDDGIARVLFRLGRRTGSGNHRVTALSDGFAGYVLFRATARTHPPQRIVAESGDHQMALVGLPAPLPLKVLVVDDMGNPVEGVPVTFEVLAGGGNIDGQASKVVATNSDGEAWVFPTLGTSTEPYANVIQASFPGSTEPPARFELTGAKAGLPNQTRISGIVLDNQEQPIPNATVSIEGTSLTTTTNEEGRFELSAVPVGRVKLLVDGSTTTRPGTWPYLVYELIVVPGQENTVGGPIYLPQVNEGEGAAMVGGPETVTIQVPGAEQAELTVYPNSVTCPDGSAQCVVSISQVARDRVPMAPPKGSIFTIALTIQPAGTRFDPPARLCVPTNDPSLTPGTQIEMYSFDHDLEDWISIGTGTVDDRGVLCTDPGFGVVKAGWHGGPPPPPPCKCIGKCQTDNPCQTASCNPDTCACETHDKPDHTACTDDDNDCTIDECIGGSCQHNPKPPGSHCFVDANECTNGICEGTTCSPTDYVPYGISCPGPDLPPPGPNEKGCVSKQCDGAGSCEWLPANENGPCHPDDTVCKNGHCEQGTCQLDDYAPIHTPCNKPTKTVPGSHKDCKNVECDGSGTCQEVPANEGKPCNIENWDGKCGQPKCQDGQCKADTDGQPCDDGDICTCAGELCKEGSCGCGSVNPFQKCKVPCAPGEACDKCQAGECRGDPIPPHTESVVDIQKNPFSKKVCTFLHLTKGFASTVAGFLKLGGCAVLDQSNKIEPGSDAQCAISGSLTCTNQCCPADETTGTPASYKTAWGGSLGGGIGVEITCDLVCAIPIPKFISKWLANICLYAEGSMAFSVSGSLEPKDVCKGESRFCVSGSGSGSVGVGVRANFTKALQIKGGASIGAGVSVKCCSGHEGDQGEWWVGKGEIAATVTVFKFISKKWVIISWPGWSGTFCPPGFCSDCPPVEDTHNKCPSTCSDANDCTQDWCDPAVGTCHHDPLDGNGCNDYSACTENDICHGTSCSGTPIDCNDDNACTSDTCDPEIGCVWTNLTGTPCSDDDACTAGDHCEGGYCTFTDYVDCDDNEFCTDDWCQSFAFPDSPAGCHHDPKTGTACDDNNACTTQDECNQFGKCAGGPPLDCDDHEACTDDSCDPATGCKHTARTGQPCTDNDACTNGDVCTSFGTCQSGPPLDCDDGNPCTTDGCDPSSGCTHTPNALPCSDNNACTSGDHCSGGSCQPGAPLDCDDGNNCTTDGCNPATGCTHVANSAGCSDGNVCTTGDHCAGGACVSSGALDCADNNPCTTDGCSAATGCYHVPNNAPCDDGDACTAPDQCSGGACQGGAPVDCNDGIDCTVDSCNQATGCKHTPDDAACDDANPCTDDTCSVDAGCQHTNNTASCDDGDDCTTNDQCSAGSCQGGAPPDCDDGIACTTDTCVNPGGCQHTPDDAACDDANVCTDDTCDPTAGCQHTANAEPCQDGDACTVHDHCVAGTCMPGALLDCDDGDPNTSEACYPATGCSVTPTSCFTSVWSENFDSGGAAGFTLTASGTKGACAFAPVAWWWYYSSPAALWFGDPAQMNYDCGLASGTATTPALAVPNQAGVRFVFYVRASIDHGATTDTITVDVVDVAAGTTTTVWTKANLGAYDAWRRVEIPLDAWAGKNVQVRFSFATGSDVDNAGEGLYFDNLSVVVPCTP